MSTRCTVLYDEKWHLYEEILDHEGLYLELEGSDIDYEVSPGYISVRIPNEILKQILLNSKKIEEFINRGPIEFLSEGESIFGNKDNA